MAIIQVVTAKGKARKWRERWWKWCFWIEGKRIYCEM